MKTIKYIFLTLVSGIALLFIYGLMPVGNKPSFAAGIFGEKYQKVLLQGSDDIYYVEEFTPWLEGDFAFNLYKGNGLTRVGQTGRLYRHDTDINNLSTLIRFYRSDDKSYNILEYIYKPATKELMKGDK